MRCSLDCEEQNMRDKEVERILSTYKVYIDTCSLMRESNGFFEFDLIPLLLKNNKKIYMVENVRNELNKQLTIPSKSASARYGLNNLQLLEDNELLVIEGSHLSMHADGAMIPVLFEARRWSDVCLITEDKNLALDVLANLKNIHSTDFYHDIQAIKIRDGRPWIWNAEDILQYKGDDEEPIEKMTLQNISSKLLIGIVVDNSISMKGERIDSLKASLKTFVDEMSAGDLRRDVEYEIVAFEDFSPKVLKKFIDEEFNINSLVAGKIPLLDKAISQCVLDIEERENELKTQGAKLYKPWLIVLSDGQSFDETNQSANRIEVKKSGSGLLFLPFNLSNDDLNPKLNPLEQQKRFIKIGQNKTDAFIKWLIDFVVTRLTTPADKPISIDKKAFEGWAILK